MSRRLGAQGRRQVHRRNPSKNPKACEPCGQPSHLTRNTVAALRRLLRTTTSRASAAISPGSRAATARPRGKKYLLRMM
jgi:hypothetical protein